MTKQTANKPIARLLSRAIAVIPLIILMGLGLVGCGQSAWDKGIQTYAKRAASVLKAEHAVAAVDHAALKYPSRRTLTAPLPQSQIGMIDFLRLSACDLQRLVGGRNSGLGKVMAASGVAFYTAEFIALAQSCLAKELVPSDLIDPLKAAVKQKQQALPLIVWNALMAGQEFAQFYSLSNRANPSINHQLPTELESALAQLITLTQQLLNPQTISSAFDYNANRQAFEQALGVLASGSYGGRLVLQTTALAQQLTLTHQQLNAVWQATPLCRQSPSGQLIMARGTKEPLMHVLHNYYMPEVQGLAVRLLNQHKALNQQMQRLTTALNPQKFASGSFATAYKNYQQIQFGDNSASAQLEAAIDEHTVFWQQVLKDCRLSPGA